MVGRPAGGGSGLCCGKVVDAGWRVYVPDLGQCAPTGSRGPSASQALPTGRSPPDFGRAYAHTLHLWVKNRYCTCDELQLYRNCLPLSQSGPPPADGSFPLRPGGGRGIDTAARFSIDFRTYWGS